jgi:hypothetical protein
MGDLFAPITQGLSCNSHIPFVLLLSAIQVMHGYLFRQERSYGLGHLPYAWREVSRRNL